MRLLNGAELAGFIQERQAHQVRGLRQAHHVQPKLAIVLTVNNPVIDTYVRLKQQYGAEILVDVAVHQVPQTEVKRLLSKLSKDKTVHGIIVQLPLADPAETDELVNLIAPQKDVDGLGERAEFDSATALAIQWLLAGYNIDLRGKQVLIIGRGKLVGAPLEKLLKTTGLDPRMADRQTPDLQAEIEAADVIITATGQPGLLTPDMLKQGAVVVDAGTTSEDGKTVGDVAPEVYQRDDLIITPQKGGVGPLTVAALFENVIRAAQKQAGL